MQISVVYIVLRNVDTTEGRGPMVFDRVFASPEDADRYCMSRPGIFGSPQRTPQLASVDGFVRHNRIAAVLRKVGLL